MECHKKSQPKWNFPVDYNDHFETPRVAYEDIGPALDAIAESLGKSREDLIIYDPYWCQGRMLGFLATLGFKTVINRNQDFYRDVKKKCVPGG